MARISSWHLTSYGRGRLADTWPLTRAAIAGLDVNVSLLLIGKSLRQRSGACAGESPNFLCEQAQKAKVRRREKRMRILSWRMLPLGLAGLLNLASAAMAHATEF